MRFHLNHRIKKFICGSMAVVVTVTGVFVMGMSYSNNAYAKATLQSIEGIIADASATDGNGEPINPFTILEVVPDVVSPTNNMVQNSNGEYLEVKLTYGTDTIPFTQNMGTAGYYIDGQEPIV